MYEIFKILFIALPSQRVEGGGGISPTRPITPVLINDEGCDGAICTLGRGGATDENFLG